MKKLLSVITALSLVAIFAACAPKSNSGSKVENNSSLINEVTNSSSAALQTGSQLTREEALEIALREAGVKRDEIRELEIEKDYENGVLVYEIDFESKQTEYSFDVNAKDGTIVEREKERD